MNDVEVSGLCKEYPSFSLKDVTFSLKKGTITGFVGRNGAGKTTVIKSMLNLVHPSSGNITFFGLRINDRETDIKKRIGYSDGAVAYYPRKKMKDILDVTSRFYLDWDSDKCGKYTEMFKLDIKKTPAELSEGMKVKFNLLLALSHGAEVLILDEPTSGLDPFSREEILQTLIGLKNEGTTILFSTHIISDLEKCADSIVYIKEGRIAADCTKEEFLEKYGNNGESLEDAILRIEGCSL